MQDSWRAWFGRTPGSPTSSRCWGAIATFSSCSTRTSTCSPGPHCATRRAGAYHAARTLGARPREAARRVVLPLVRPAIAAGGAIVMMETLTDFATVQYFGVDTVSVGVFRIWRGTYDRDAASEIATLVLAFALLAIGFERIARGSGTIRPVGRRGAGMEPQRLVAAGGLPRRPACARASCSPRSSGRSCQLVIWAVEEQTGDRGTPLLEEYPSYLWHSLQLVAITVLICIVVAVILSNAQRFGRPALDAAGQPGDRDRIRRARPRRRRSACSSPSSGSTRARMRRPRPAGRVATGSFLVLVYAYVVRFLAPGLARSSRAPSRSPRR